MAKDDKKNAMNQKAEAQNKEPPKNERNEQTKTDSEGTAVANNSGGCNSFAKVLIYLIPLALYVPWAYRMYKGNACCPEVPKVPTASMSPNCTATGNSSYSAPISRIGQRFRAPKDQHQSCCDQHQYSEPSGEDGEIQHPHDGGKTKSVNIDKEREECLDQSKQCLEKCMEKCFDADRIEKKKKKKRKERKNEDDDNDC